MDLTSPCMVVSEHFSACCSPLQTAHIGTLDHSRALSGDLPTPECSMLTILAELGAERRLRGLPGGGNLRCGLRTQQRAHR